MAPRWRASPCEKGRGTAQFAGSRSPARRGGEAVHDPGFGCSGAGSAGVGAQVHRGAGSDPKSSVDPGPSQGPEDEWGELCATLLVVASASALRRRPPGSPSRPRATAGVVEQQPACGPPGAAGSASMARSRRRPRRRGSSRPSPVMATTSPRLLQRPGDPELLLRVRPVARTASWVPRRFPRASSLGELGTQHHRVGRKPASRATDIAVAGWSPVIMTTRIPARLTPGDCFGDLRTNRVRHPHEAEELHLPLRLPGSFRRSPPSISRRAKASTRGLGPPASPRRQRRRARCAPPRGSCSVAPDALA